MTQTPSSLTSHAPQADASAKSVLPRMIRADGALRASFSAAHGRTSLATLYEQGGYRLKFPKGEYAEAVIINTGGGMAGGDRFHLDLDLASDAHVTMTTQSAEKVYRADAQQSEIALNLRLASGAHLTWLPQETLLFSGARLQRTCDVDLAATASLELIESVIFGRIAMGEQLTAGLFRDHWRIKRDGKLIYADNIALQGNISKALDRAAIGKGARAIATFLCISADAVSRLDAARAALSLSSCECGASAWNGMLVARFAAPDPAVLRRSVIAFLENFRAVPLPRVWQC